MLTGKPAPFGTSAARKSPMADAIKQNPLLAGAGSKGTTALHMLDRGKLSLQQALIYVWVCSVQTAASSGYMPTRVA